MKEKPTQKYWFKRKLYGWGWYPSSIEGWITTILYIAFIVYLAYGLDPELSFEHAIGIFFLPFISITIVFIAIAYVKGESPKWQWGKREEDDVVVSDTTHAERK